MLVITDNNIILTIMLISAKKRCKIIRKTILQLSQKVGALHIGGSFSAVEILDSIYNILLKKNDKFILSKGHTGILQYSLLYYKKIISKKKLFSYCQKNSTLGVHPDYGTPGIEASTGSLGHGLGLAAGMSFGLSKKNKIYVVISDGELMEGTTWEYALTISSFNINNIILIIDNNGIQSATRSKDTHPTLEPISKKFQSFGWDVKRCNGHNTKDIVSNIENKKNNKPLALIANTIKGYPVSFMSDVPMWHYRSPNKIEYEKAIQEINKF